MSDLVNAIGQLERVKSVSSEDMRRVVQQSIRLMNAARNMYVFDGNADANV